MNVFLALTLTLASALVLIHNTELDALLTFRSPLIFPISQDASLLFFATLTGHLMTIVRTRWFAVESLF